MWTGNEMKGDIIFRVFGGIGKRGCNTFLTNIYLKKHGSWRKAALLKHNKNDALHACPWHWGSMF